MLTTLIPLDTISIAFLPKPCKLNPKLGFGALGFYWEAKLAEATAAPRGLGFRV